MEAADFCRKKEQGKKMKKMMEKNTVERKGHLTEEDQKKEICDAEKQQEKLRFECDYLEGAVPEIMQRLMETNLVQTPGYSEDVYCESAREKIRALCGQEDAAVHFLVGGTQTNLTVICAALRPHQGVVAASTGHINVHETGAIEAAGHKVLTVPGKDGRLNAAQVEELCRLHYADASFEHMVQPGMVYISYPTEYGTLYTKEELREIHRVCKKYDMPLFIDGARLGYGLMSQECDLTLSELADLCEVFYIGGTKCGALFGEAVVILEERLKKDFRYLIKQRGGMLAKGRLLGLQFDTLFTDDLYFCVCKKADQLAQKLRSAFEAKGYRMLVDSPTNQQFPVLPDTEIDRLSGQFSFSFWEKVDETHSAVRFCTSWATTEEAVERLIAVL